MTLPDYPTLFWITAVAAMLLIGVSNSKTYSLQCIGPATCRQSEHDPDPGLIPAPLTFAGVQLGVWLKGRFRDRYFTYAIYALLVWTGLELASGVSVIHLLF